MIPHSSNVKAQRLTKGVRIFAFAKIATLLAIRWSAWLAIPLIALPIVDIDSFLPDFSVL